MLCSCGEHGSAQQKYIYSRKLNAKYSEHCTTKKQTSYEHETSYHIIYTYYRICKHGHGQTINRLLQDCSQNYINHLPISQTTEGVLLVQTLPQTSI